jgi:Raf kinase inhibitor-like YbhB/YbcL family protein
MMRIVPTLLACGLFSLAQTPPGTFTLSSPAFTKGGAYPAEYTCDGDRAAPPLTWQNAPAGTRSFAITMHHPPGAEDKHVYMVIYNIPAGVTTLPKNSRDIGTWGINTVNRQPEYTPPCSKGPGNKTYTLTVYALSSEPDLKFDNGRVTMDMLLAAIKEKTLATSAMDVVYARPFGRP